MDPNANLQELLDLANDIASCTLSDDDDDEVDRMADLVIALDDWLRKGGVLPRRWRAAAMPSLHAAEKK